MNLGQLLDKTKNKIRYKSFSKDRKLFANSNKTIVCSNCIGGLIYHDLGLKFNSPFIDLWIKPKDYIKLLKHFRTYMESDLKFVKKSGVEYPVGILKDIKIYFQHYTSEEQVKSCWERRKERIDYDNLYIIFTERDDCTYEDLIQFDQLPYLHKVVLVHKNYDNLKNTVCIKGYEQEKSLGVITDYKSICSLKRHYDDWDYIKWLKD